MSFLTCLSPQNAGGSGIQSLKYHQYKEFCHFHPSLCPENRDMDLSSEKKRLTAKSAKKAQSSQRILITKKILNSMCVIPAFTVPYFAGFQWLLHRKQILKPTQKRDR